MKSTNLYLLWRDRSSPRRFRNAVSLHSHTLHSRENLAFVPRYTAGVPVLQNAIRHQQERYRSHHRRTLDFSRAFWRPPLSPAEALSLEQKQIEERLELDPMVSLTDHDDIQAGVQLSLLDPRPPVSVEWTIPFGPSFFHIGVHNLPRDRAHAIHAKLAEATANPARDAIRDALATLHAFDETLIVWNHPAWDEARVGPIAHAQLLGQFLGRFGEFFHALELNGLRPWSENRRVIEIAARSGHPLISGGDRHGLEPNANLNLTNAADFSEFVQEIRCDQHSDVVFMPQYREPLRVRMIETIFDALRDYPEFPEGRRRWCERIFYEHIEGEPQPLTELLPGNAPWLIEWFLHAVRASRHPQVRSALKLALADANEVAL